MAGSSTIEEVPPQHQVFINFRGEELRYTFVSHLVEALENDNIKVFIDNYADKGEPLEILLTKIQESRIALAILSMKYTESIWCLRELAMIKDCVEKGTLAAIPIFYKIDPSMVKYVTGKFGDEFRRTAQGSEKKERKNALKWIPSLIGFTVEEKSPESDKIKEIVEEVKKRLKNIPSEGSQTASVDPSENTDNGDSQTSSDGEKDKTFGTEQSLKDLDEKLDLKYKKTRIIGLVGMPGIGKTTLLKKLFTTWQDRFARRILIDQIRVKSNYPGLDFLLKLLLKELLKSSKVPEIDNAEDPFNMYKDELLKRKILVILDDVSKREQIDALLRRRDWIGEGSRIIIATSDMSLTDDLVDDTYMVQNLNHRDSLQLFRYHAFDDYQAYPQKEDFTQLSEGFLHYARGHPLALKVLGGELKNQKRGYWNSHLRKLAENPSRNIGSVFQVSYDELTSDQKEAFHDIACFRSQDVDYVESLLPSSEAMSKVKALTDKFLLNTCDGRVEMHDLLYTFLRDLDSKSPPQGERRLLRHKDIIKEGEINVLQNQMRPANVRGIFLDLSEVKRETSLDREHFINMCNLRYLKFYNSHCPQDCKTKNKINLPDGLELPLKKVRCFHWLKFPLEELPNDFDPVNLVELKLPYSEIEQLWEGVKDTPILKWVDLSHSSKLSNLSGLYQARSLQRLNLEGCIALDIFPHDMIELTSLAFLNLKGCTKLECLPVMNLISLKTLILSGCSNFDEFPLVSENLEALYLDGTAISRLPDNVVNLKRLILLNMKDCEKLKNISACVSELKALQKLVLSGCSNLKDFPEINESSFSILLMDGTSTKMMPQLPSVQYLCLSRNDHISCLPAGINQLSQLTRLDLKYCTKLTSVPELPPNLQYLDAHGCSSLKSVAKPLARIMPAVQNRCTFNFTNCCNLEQASKDEITSYSQRKCQLLSDARKQYNEGLSSEVLFSTCFPGCKVPSWFCYEEGGSLLQRKLLPHWHDKRLSGIALCAVVSFSDCPDQISCFSVTCAFKIKAEDKSRIPFTCPVGSWTRDGDKKDKIELDHVFMTYISCPHTIRCLEDENSDKCNFTEASLEFNVTGGTSVIGKFTVSSCGLSLVYARDKNENSSHEAKYDMPVEVSFQEPQQGMKEEQRKLKKQEFMIDDQRRSEKPEGVSSSATQTCGASVTPRMEDLQANG